MDANEKVLAAVWGLPRFARFWPGWVLPLKVYEWGIRIGPAPRLLSGIIMIPRAELRWEKIGLVIRRGQALRFSRESLAPITFRAFGDISPIVKVLEEQGVRIEAVGDWPG